MIYNLLPEWEVFSASRGGAIPKNVANMMRHDPSRSVVCASADDTWGFNPERILVIRKFHTYSKLKGRGRLPLSITKMLLRLVFQPLLARLKPEDIVWCHSQPLLFAALERPIRSKGGKLVFHSHCSLALYSARWFRLCTPDASIFVSEAMRREALGLFPGLENTYCVYNGADERLFFPPPDRSPRQRETPIVLYVGRLHPEKGVHVLIDAMRILQERKVDAFCRLVGSSFAGGSRETPYVKSLISSSPSNVEFAGFRSANLVAEEYRKADIACCPSVCPEAFGNVNIEAMASGIPVVASRIGGIPEIASEGGMILVEPGSAVELADALQQLLEHCSLRAQVAADGLRSFRQRFTESLVAEQYRQIADDLSFPTRRRDPL